MFVFYTFAPDLQTLLKILEGSEHLFSRYGTKSITMDDVARELAMSKKTLYQYVTDKNDLVEKTLEFYLQRHRHTCEVMIEENQNPIDAMLAMGDFFSQQMRETSPALMFDLRKYHGTAWQKLIEFRFDCIVNQLKTNLTNGIEQEYYRPDIDINIIPRLYISMIDGILEGTNFPRDAHKFEDIVKQMLQYHIHGIATQKGIDYLKQRINP